MRRFAFRVLAIGLGFAVTPVLAASGPGPGLYETRTKMTAFSAKGFTPAQVQQILAGKPEVDRQCITAEDLAKDNWLGNQSDPSCSYTKAPFVGGRINASAVCSKDKRSTKINGTYTATSFNMTLTSTSPTGSATMTMTGRRIGNCTGNEDEE